MPERKAEVQQDEKKKGAGDLFIVDNSDADWKVRDYLREWTELAHTFDIATGYFEIGALLALDGLWQKLDKLRILMGDEVTKRTKRTLLTSLARVKETLDDSIEREKESNDFLHGVPGIAEAIGSGKIECRVYTKETCSLRRHLREKGFVIHESNA